MKRSSWASAWDAFPKLTDDFSKKTRTGATITIASSIIALLLFCNEIRLFATTSTIHELGVDTGRGELLDIQFNITFPRLPCSWLSVDTMDVSGEQHLDVDHDVFKQRLTPGGTKIKHAIRHDLDSTKQASSNGTIGKPACGSCYGSETEAGQCCNTCDEVRAQYRKKGWGLMQADGIEQCKHDAYLEAVKEMKGEGCRVWGTLQVNKVAGNFHFAPGRSYQQGSMHVHDIAPFGGARIDVSHTIHSLSFGKPYPGMKNPLDGVAKAQEFKSERSNGAYQYFVKVVPTHYTALGSKAATLTNQFSVTENYRETEEANRLLPGVFYFVEPSPIRVKISEMRPSFLHFLTSVCAIVGGVFTVAGLIDAALYAGERIIREKMQMGKLS